jgi:type VI secretion system secreted protein VgrG
MSTNEQLGRLFEYELDVLSKKDSIKLEDLLGKRVTVSLAMADDSKRYFDGFVSRFALVGAVGDLTWYHATLRPWLWFLTRTSDCRIFQEKKVPEIIKQIFKEYNFSDIDDQLKGSYRKWVYCVQYRETDFNFVSRLMEQEGIYYYFTHEDGKHTMVLADDPGAHARIFEDEVPYFQPTETVVGKEDSVQDWNISQELQPAKYTLIDYNFETPKASQEVKKSGSPKHKEKADYEFYDYPGEYVDTGEGDAYVKARLEELSAQYEVARGAGNVRGMYAGGVFKLIDHPRDDQNHDYLLLSCSHELRTNEYESGGATGETSYSCAFTAIESKVQYRSPRVTPKPIIQGPQTAVVVGPSGEEIYTDKYGRIKVQFHWDREGKKDENSSCWIRVAQLWAGKAWGAIHIPRMGQEVIVDFLEGDPDRPIITGRVYNADMMPPYELPGNMTQSGIKSRSTKEGAGANFNEIRMEDKKGSEELYIHAEKNHTNITENDRSEDVGHDRSLHVGHDKSEAVDNNKSITVGVDHTESIGSNKKLDVGANHDETIGASKTLSVGADHSETIGSNMTINIGSNLTENVAIAYTENVGAAMAINVGAAMAIDVGAAMSTNVGAANSLTVGAGNSTTVSGDDSESVGGGKTVTVAKDLGETISGGHTETVTKAYGLKAKSVSIEGEDEINIKTGDASISMKKDGTITIKGKDITVKGSGKINIKADSDIVMKGSKILEN